MEGVEDSPKGGPPTTLKDRLIGAVMLRPRIYRELGADRAATVQSIAVVAMAALVSAYLVMIIDEDAHSLGAVFAGDFAVGAWIKGGVVAVVLFSVWAAILWTVGKLYGGRADYMSLVRGLSFAYVPLLGLVPAQQLAIAEALGRITVVAAIGVVVVYIWATLAAIVAVREIHRVRQGRAVATVLIPVALVFMSWFLLLLIQLALYGPYGAAGG
jgi:hypothetical protein